MELFDNWKAAVKRLEVRPTLQATKLLVEQTLSLCLPNGPNVPYTNIFNYFRFEKWPLLCLLLKTGHISTDIVKFWTRWNSGNRSLCRDFPAAKLTHLGDKVYFEQMRTFPRNKIPQIFPGLVDKAYLWNTSTESEPGLEWAYIQLTMKIVPEEGQWFDKKNTFMNPFFISSSALNFGIESSANKNILPPTNFSRKSTRFPLQLISTTWNEAASDTGLPK